MCAKYVLELNQENVLIEGLLQTIVTSRRLLADHVETLELAEIDSELSGSRRNEIIVTPAAGVLGVTAATVQYLQPSWSTLKLLTSVAAGVYGACWAFKLAHSLKNRWIIRRLQRTVELLNEIDSGIRRTIAYLREVKVLKLDDKKAINVDKLAQNCIHSIIEISKIIFEVAKSLEESMLPPRIASLYEPLDDLDGCSYFERNIEEFSTKDIKDFYNLFLFFQSQLLTRLSLSIAHNRKIGIEFIRTKCVTLHSVLDQHLKLIVEPLSLQSNRIKQQNSIRKPMNCVPLSNLKVESLEITSRLLAIAQECVSTDEAIQDITNDMILNRSEANKTLQNIFADVKQVETSLVLCIADYQRLVLACHKLLLVSSQMPNDSGIGENEESDKALIDSTDITPKVSEDQPDESSDYFAFRDPAAENSLSTENEAPYDHNQRPNLDNELDTIDKKIVKKQFAPVLKQLKTAINPINDAMKERERKYLASVGVDTKRLDESSAEQINSESDSDSEGSEIEARIKARSKYDEMRSFLQDKQQISFLPNLPLPELSRANEDILE